MLQSNSNQAIEKTSEHVTHPMEYLQDYPIVLELINNYELVVYGILGVVFIGMILGWTKNTVVFYDYDDMALCFGVFATPIAMCFIVYYLQLSSLIGNTLVVGIPTLCILTGVLYKTWISGVRFSLPIVLVTKLVLGFFYIFAIWQLLSPSGSTAKSRRGSRASATFLLMVFTPVIVSLVKNKSGVLFNSNTISGRGIKGVGKIRTNLEE